MSGCDFVKIGGGGGKAPLQQTSACAGHSFVEHGQKTAFAPARERLCNFQIFPRCGINQHHPRQRLALWPLQEGQIAFLRDVQIIDHRPHGGEIRTLKLAKGL